MQEFVVRQNIKRLEQRLASPTAAETATLSTLLEEEKAKLADLLAHPRVPTTNSSHPGAR